MQETFDGIPALDVDPYDLAYSTNPYPLYEIVRETAPIVYLKKYNTYSTARYDEILEILEDWRNFSSSKGVGLQDLSLPGAFRPISEIVEVDPPAHTEVRRACAKVLSPRQIREWREGFETAAVELVDGLLEKRDLDGVPDIAEAYVTTVFPRSLGIRRTFREHLIDQGDYAFSSLGPHNEVFERAKARFEPIIPWWTDAQKRENLDPDGFGAKLYAAEDAGQMKPGIANKVMINFLGGGLHTTISALGSMMMHLSRQPQTWRRLREDRSLVKQPFEETLRLETPATTWYRATLKPVEFRGVTLRAGMKVHMLTASANRDPRRWERPDAFDIDRSAMGHLALGRGVHTCIGQMIARLEAECLLSAMLDRIGSLEPTGEPVYRPLNALRTLNSLPLRVTAA